MKRAIPEVVHEASGFWILNKPAGMLTVPERLDRGTESLQEWTKRNLGPCWMVHRLDKETSGLICLARNADMHAHFNNAFAQRAVEKAYFALVKGKPSATGTLDFRIRDNGSRGTRMRVDNKGKESVTEFRVEESFRGYTLLNLAPKTGRTHQIRVHCAHAGFPLVGDAMYGGPTALYLSEFKRNYNRTDEQERPLLGRVALHAGLLRLPMPGAEPIEFQADMPKDMTVALKQLRRHAQV